MGDLKKGDGKSQDLSPAITAVTSGQTADCPACFKPLVAETVQILQGRRYTPEAKWVDSTVQRCEACKHTFGGTLEDRLAYVDGVYGYKYFGDYGLSDEQSDAVWEAKAIASMVPELLEALREILTYEAMLKQIQLPDCPPGYPLNVIASVARAAIATVKGG